MRKRSARVPSALRGAVASRNGTHWWKALTILIPSSPVPSNPSTATLRAMFASFALVPNLPRASKLIQFDGTQDALPAARKEAYREFMRRVQTLAKADLTFRRTTINASSSFLFSAHNVAVAVRQVARPRAVMICLRSEGCRAGGGGWPASCVCISARQAPNAARQVRTKYMLIMQHDFILTRPFNAKDLLHSMDSNPVIKHVMRHSAPLHQSAQHSVWPTCACACAPTHSCVQVHLQIHICAQIQHDNACVTLRRDPAGRCA